MFRFEQPILFKHCDPAGIVFYPRYFEMMSDCVEAFFDKVVEWPFKDIHKVGAVPTAEIRTRFLAPSRLGDHLVFNLKLTTVGRTSCGIEISADCEGEARFQTELTLVNVDGGGKPQAWPEQVKQRLLDQSAFA
ncbi:thioesterase superfamily protein [Stappia aggregata IAM 12614]|uniref:Thioesterase superfamily protein n=1 Tax=Roseibium aggregatum (strain ATCC 25650 / DSM 13394 / JCM 20685 / NBRC 16684 / NCIMB 2208 / IAM 12614 / B1) TaxID=384765 RepID=A0NM41_ROSAI|nr:thioesterase family protein [Roseibium aggregatum]EAV46136.1 thioesterase superfamily protein [Stappia aggregata IAM 12614] [Roseibium aggregatum IAM 12614]